MEVVCSKCAAHGPAAGHRIDSQGNLLLRCAACGEESPLQTGGTHEPASPRSDGGGQGVQLDKQAPERQQTPAVRLKPAPAEQPSEALESDTLRWLLTSELEDLGPVLPPEAGLPPVKCRKCGHRQHTDQPCEKCGLDPALIVGTPVWERVPPSQRVAMDMAMAIWERLERVPKRQELHEHFLSFCASKGLDDYALNRYRSWLADHPSDTVSRAHYEELVERTRVLAMQPLVQKSDARGGRLRLSGKQLYLATTALLIVILSLVLLRMSRDIGTVSGW